MAQDKQKIVILGGGVSSMAAAWELTNQPDWQSKYEITLYQVGWRLGGKCASGRGPYGRIEEHGIHVLMGFYDHVFDILQSCYGELNRPVGAPLATWEESVAKQDNVVLMEDLNGRWVPWQFKFPTNNKIPGSTKGRRHPHAVIYELLRQLLAIHLSSPLHRRKDTTSHRDLIGAVGHHDELKQAAEVFNPAANNPAVSEDDKERILEHYENLLNHLLSLPLVQQAMQPTKPATPAPTAEGHGLLHLIEKAEAEAKKLVQEVETHVIEPILRDIRRAIIQLKMGFAMLRGIFKDGVLTIHGWNFAAINNLDLREWIGQNLGNITGDHVDVIDSAPIRGVYDLVFAYTDGVPGQYALEAGTSLSFMLQIVFEYKGAIYWKMQAGMGDVVLAPMYLTLKQRGVKFEFFHAVTNLRLSPDRQSVGVVELARQVDVRGGGEYDPLIDVKALPCFPAEPVYDRLAITPAEEAELHRLQAEFNGLESPWTPWQDKGQVVLEAGKDFDQVILGISIGAFPHICPELIAASPTWQAMVENIKTTATQSAQLWLQPTLEETGWQYGVCVLDAYAQPLNSWTDMSDLIDREDWPADATLGSIAYFTGPLPNQSVSPIYVDKEYPRQQHNAAEATLGGWLEANTSGIFPAATLPGSTALNPDLLVAPGARNATERFEAQYWRANVNPSDHYVLSVPGSSQYRLGADESGFSNLILTGDWTRSGMNAGSVEAAATSGVLAAQALLKTQG